MGSTMSNCRIPVNILDQIYAVKCHALGTNEIVANSESDEDIDTEGLITQRDFIEKAFIFLYCATIHDSMKKLDQELRARKAARLEAMKKQARLTAKRDTVDLAASAAKPTDAMRILSK